MTHKEIVTNFLHAAATGNVLEAFERFASPEMIHHNPYSQASTEALAAAMIENQKEHPDKQFEIKNVIEENNLVAVHSKVSFLKTGMTISVVHIFKIEHHHIVELWDIGQPVPADSPNAAGMF